MKIVNLCQHAITLQLPCGERITVPPSGTVARVATVPGKVGMRMGIPIASPTVYGIPLGLPSQEEEYRRKSDGKIFKRMESSSEEDWWGWLLASDGEKAEEFGRYTPDNFEEEWEEVEQPIYLVSEMVLARTFRSDVFAPGTGPNDGAIRYPADHAQAGQVEAVTRLIAAV